MIIALPYHLNFPFNARIPSCPCRLPLESYRNAHKMKQELEEKIRKVAELCEKELKNTLLEGVTKTFSVKHPSASLHKPAYV
jgi:hypothetical protein